MLNDIEDGKDGVDFVLVFKLSRFGRNAAYVFKWGIVGVYELLTTEEIFRLVVSLIIFKRRKWMISLS